MPIIPPNNTTGLYGIDTTVNVNNAVTGTNLNITGNATVGGNISAGNNIAAVGNISGNYIFGNGAFLTGVAASYGNAEVADYLASGTNSNNMITTGNVSGTYILGNGSLLTGIAATYGNANVATYLASFGSNTISTTGNVTAGYFIGDGSQLTGLPASYGNADVANYLANFGSNTISTTGNITGGNFVGSGAALTSIPAGNIVGVVAQATQAAVANTANSVAGANVTGTVANATYATSAGSASTATTATTAGTVTTASQPNITSVGTLTSLSVSGNINGGNVNSTFFGSGAGLSNLTGANVTGTVANATYATSAGSATTAGTVTTAAQPNITSVGTLTSLSSSGNVTAAYFIGNGSLLSDINAANIVGAYGNANVANFLANYGANTISTTGNIAGGNVIGTHIGNGAGLSSLTGANVTGTVANATYATSAGSATTATSATTAGTVTTAAQPNITSVGTLTSLSVSGNIVGGNISTTGTFTTTSLSATGNITGSNVVATTLLTGPQLITTGGSGNITGANYVNANYFVGNGSQLTSIAASGSNTQIQFNNAGVLGANSLFTWDNANAQARIGNILITQANNNIKNVNAWDANTSPQQARITIGTGYDGTWTDTTDPVVATRGAQLAVINKQTIGNADVNQSARAIAGAFFADMNGATLTNGGRRMQGGSFALAVGNGTMTLSAGPIYPAAAGGGGALQVGNITLAGASTFAGTTTNLSHGTGALNTVLIGGNATVGNAVGSLNSLQFFTNNTGNARSAIGSYSQFTGGTSGQPVPGNVYGYYMPGTTNNHGTTNSNFWRVADNYYFLVNEDDVAQNRLGSLRRYHEFNGVSATTSGSLTIDKNNGQVQQVNLSGNITSLAFSNFVSSASDSVNTDEQCDTVTIVFNQGATGGYGVTFPTGSTYKYAGNVTALTGTTANSVSLVSVSAIRISGTTTYLITISPEFV